MLYKYLQGNDINEGRELFAVSKDGRIPSSVLKLWKEIFRLDHAWQEGKGRWRQPGRRVSLIRKHKQGSSRGGSCCPWGADLDTAIHEGLGGLSPIQQRVFLAQLWKEARDKHLRAMGSPSSLHSPSVTGAEPSALAVGKLRGARHKLLPCPPQLPSHSEGFA